MYHEIIVDLPHEIASCIENVSLKNGKAFVHADAVLPRVLKIEREVEGNKEKSINKQFSHF